MPLPLIVTWTDITLRLLMATFAAVVIGINRGERGKPAGLRTTLLVTLAAALTMIMVNLLFTTSGKTPDGFVNLDMMRLPLGLLTGMGFIGAGAIVKKGETVQGVTTAATLWFSTIIGLGMGAGLLALGLIGLGLPFLILTLFRHVESFLPQMRDATLTLMVTPAGPTLDALRHSLTDAGLYITSISFATSHQALHSAHFHLRWKAHRNSPQPPAILAQLSQNPAIRKLAWKC